MAAASPAVARTLNARQARFVAEYLVDLNATQAAIRAGYSPKTAKQIGSKLLTVVAIHNAVVRGRAELAAKTGFTAEWVLDRLEENRARAMQAEPVLDREGKPTGEYVYQGAVANRALELIGKHAGMWKENGGLQLPPGSEGVLVWRFGDREIRFR